MSQVTIKPSQNDAATNETLTLAQIEARYPDQWVLIEDPELDDDLEIIQGRVVAHSPDRADVSRYDRQHRPKFTAYLYVGEEPSDDTYYMLNPYVIE